MKYLSILLILSITLLIGTSLSNPKVETDMFPETTFSPSDSIRTFLSISDIHLDIDATSIHKNGHNWGDTDQKLWQYTKAKLNHLVSKKDSLNIDFIVFTGDLPYHGWNQNKRAKNIGVVLSFLSQLSETSSLPLLFVPGNNDSLEGDYKSFRDKSDHSPFVTDSQFASEWPFILNQGNCGLNSTGSCYIDSSQVYGYFSSYPLANQKLRFIGLNTVIHNNRKNSLCYNPPADGLNQAKAAKLQMDWFLSQMDSVFVKDEKVLIAMHIPPGTDGYGGDSLWANFATSSGETIQNAFIKSVSKNKNNVIGILTGHTHMDEVRLIYDDKDQFTSFCISTPGITPQHANNPGFKLFSYNAKTYEITDFKTYWSDFFRNDSVVKFDKEYTFNEAYGNHQDKSIRDRFEMWEKDSLGIIISGMQKTYKVYKNHNLTNDEVIAMKLKYNGQIKARTVSECPSF